jgi:hypothetical protein
MQYLTIDPIVFADGAEVLPVEDLCGRRQVWRGRCLNLCGEEEHSKGAQRGLMKG